MNPPYRPVQPTVKKWNCNKIFLLLINILYLLISLALIIMGVLIQLYLHISLSFLLSYGFSYNQYAHYIYIYGALLLPISCVGIAVAARQSIRLTRLYIRFLSAMTILEIVGMIVGMSLYPFLKDALWNIIQDTIDECDVTSVAYYAVVHVQMVFGCCGLNQPDTGNSTKIQTSCYSADKYTVYDSYCYPERYYEINCFDRVYNDTQDTLLIVLICGILFTMIHGLTIFSAVLHGRHIRRMRNYDMELSNSRSRHERKIDF